MSTIIEPLPYLMLKIKYLKLYCCAKNVLTIDLIALNLALKKFMQLASVLLLVRQQLNIVLTEAVRSLLACQILLNRLTE
jgi:hypothetical protein